MRSAIDIDMALFSVARSSHIASVSEIFPKLTITRITQVLCVVSSQTMRVCLTTIGF